MSLRTSRLSLAVLIPCQAFAEPAASASDPVERIRDEGLHRSQAMETLVYLTEVIGPRLSGSPGMRRANDWARAKLTDWGLENAHLESWGTFLPSWTLKRFSAQVVRPRCIPLIAFPKAWSRGLSRTLEAEAVYFDVGD
jgi:hypothetical protein